MKTLLTRSTTWCSAAWLLVASLACESVTEPPPPREEAELEVVIPDPEAPGEVEVRAEGLPDSVLIDPGSWPHSLRVFQLGASADLPPLLGDWNRDESALVFEPRFPLARGRSYRAELRAPGREVDRVFEIPAEALEPLATVRAVYPSADALPENLLRLYVHFSAPMGRGGVYEYIRLVDLESGEEVFDPWMEAEELWDPAGQRLTLLIHPGRIKRGLRPREEYGPVLAVGRAYALRVDPAWKDARGVSLAEPFEKRFEAEPADMRQPDVESWQLSAPVVETKSPLKIAFGEALDRALALRMIWVTDAAGEYVAGRAELAENETMWLFEPDRAWRAGRYRIHVDQALEDVAGNSVRALFDVDVFEKAEAPKVEVTELEFELSP